MLLTPFPWKKAKKFLYIRQKKIGNALEDEKVLGSCYFSIGLEGSKLDGNHPGILTSGIIKEPTVFIDGEPLIISGELQL